MGIPDEEDHWYLTPTGWLRGDAAAGPPGSLAAITFYSPENNMYSSAYWGKLAKLGTPDDVAAALRKFGTRPRR